MENQSRYLIGIDLGTTNSAVSYIDTQDATQTVHPFPILQLTARGLVEFRNALPSFCYLLVDGEWSPNDGLLPWAKPMNYIVGELAKDQGSLSPTRLVFSAKSWLCNAAADRKERILPPPAEESLRISPVEATKRYLAHLRDAWNHQMAKGDPNTELEQQEIVLTVPASFDEVARTLTALAAQQAGFTRVTLLEEPQAAFYEWIRANEKSWTSELQEGQVIVICDVGGGTTDFSLVQVTHTNGVLGFRRLAVGDHLLLGGDNMDSTLVHYFHTLLQAEGVGELTSLQWHQLRHEARKAKESLLATDSPAASFTVRLAAPGSRVVGGSLTCEVTASEVFKLLHTGFFDSYDRDSAIKLHKRSGMRSMGLPFEDEPSITKHLAHFLFCQGNETEKRCPDYILFNGGSMKPLGFQKAIVDSIGRWYDCPPPKVLKTQSLDLSVSRGATYYGKTRRGQGIKIGGGTPRSYYLALDVKDSNGNVSTKALTLLPRGTEEGASYEPEQTFTLLPNRPVSFKLLTSHVRLHDEQGSLVSITEEEMQPLPVLQTIIRFGKSGQDAERIPVTLGLTLTALGTLAIWLQSVKTDHLWNLEFQVRHSSGQDDGLSALGKVRSDESHDIGHLQAAQKLVEDLFLGSTTIEAGKLMEVLEGTLQSTRKDWPPSVLRALADTVLGLMDKRKRSAILERRWWNLLGFCLRPGLGFPLDDYRIERIWKLLLVDLKASSDQETNIQRLICLRRIAGGFNKGQQTQLASTLVMSNKDLKRAADIYLYSEQVRTLAAFERLDHKSKQRLAEQLVQRITSKQAIEAEYWALGRLGARELLFGSLAHVMPSSTCKDWVERLLNARDVKLEWLVFPLTQMVRRTEHPEVNLPEFLLQSTLERFEGSPLAERVGRLLAKSALLDRAQQEAMFGESLPAGLQVEHA